MKFNVKWNWDNRYDYSDGMLFFAQRIEEMLMYYTSHLYKVPAFNSYLLTAEYAKTAPLVKNGSVNSAHLLAILDEFYYSLSADIVIKSHYSQDKTDYFIGRLKGTSGDERDKFMDDLLQEFNCYPAWCKEEARKLVTQYPKEKKKIDNVLRSLISTLIGIGYNPNYIYWESKAIFSCRKNNNASPIDIFLSRFDFTEHEYTVYFPVSKKAETFRQTLETKLGFSFQEDDFSGKLEIDNSEYICVHTTVRALDRNRAAEAAYWKFSLFMRYYKFLGNRDDDFCQDKTIVLENGRYVHRPPLKPQKHSYSWNYDDGILWQNTEAIISNLLAFASFDDFSKVERMIINHNSALASPENANSFLNLWSILEIIGVSDHQNAKITEVLRAVIPILKKNYVRNIFLNLHSYMKANLSDEDYNSLFSSVTEEGDKTLKTACLVALPKYQALRKRAAGLFANYPLIRSRMLQLSADIFSRKSDFLKELGRYTKRIEWHIQRLYRTRNEIIHSGNVPENIKLLSEHLHDYADELLMEIIRKLAQAESLLTISNVIIDAEIFIDRVHKEYSRNKDAFSYEDMKFLIYGDELNGENNAAQEIRAGEN